jgi:CRISPR-associated Csx2 family protein
MARKVLISFLGFSNYKECIYYKDGFESESLRFIQEATMDYLLTLEEWNANDLAIILLTSGSKQRNWLDDGHVDPISKERINQDGLQTRFKLKGYPFKVETIENLPDGKNESELFEIFRQVYNVLENGDQLYFDITHGFRSLPMLALVLINYAKFLKHIEVKSISYGNYEAHERIKDAEGNLLYVKAPIIDLLPLSQIQDWTFAAADYLKNGNADKFSELLNSYKRSIFLGKRKGDKEMAIAIDGFVRTLNTVTDDFQTCRGKELLSQKNIKALKQKLNSLGETVIEPLNPVIQRINSAFMPFTEATTDNDNLHNGFEAAKWCMNNNLYQQAATILQEAIVSFFCSKHKLSLYAEEERKLVNGAFAKRYRLDSSIVTNEGKECIRQEIEESSTLKELVNDELICDKEINNAFAVITNERNDINHSGMRMAPHSAKVISDNIRHAFHVFVEKMEAKE